MQLAPPRQRHPGSYRDPAAQLHEIDGRIFRVFNAAALDRVEILRAGPLLESLQRAGLLVGTGVVDGAAAGFAEAALVLEHSRIPFISYPYEWPFALLKAAALCHLDVHLAALQHGATLQDASAYNVQFIGTRPVFIDAGSFIPYREGALWSAHRQFCAHFLNPLLLAAELGVPYQPWLRGSLEGVEGSSLARLLPRRRWLSLRHLLHVLLPARGDVAARRDETASQRRIGEARLPLEGLRGMLRQLHAWISTLQPRGAADTPWARYREQWTYDERESAAKRAFVQRFAAEARPALLWDLGCNDGEYTEAALAAGASYAVGLDLDAGALARAAARSSERGLALLPLHQDLVDASPPCGWRGEERESLGARGRPEGVIALAVLHHLALGRNVPLEEAVSHLVALAPRGVIEFVPKSDPTVQRMLALKGDLFPGYDAAAFEAALGRLARVVRSEAVSGSGRTLYEYSR